jgi:hypothetical protein
MMKHIGMALIRLIGLVFSIAVALGFMYTGYKLAILLFGNTEIVASTGALVGGIALVFVTYILESLIEDKS